MLKEQKWALARIKKGAISINSLLEEFNNKFKRTLKGKTAGVDGIIPLKDLRGRENNEILKIIKFLENDRLLVEGVSRRELDSNVSPHDITIRGQKYGKVNWEKAINWILTIVGLGLAAGTFYFQFFGEKTLNEIQEAVDILEKREDCSVFKEDFPSNIIFYSPKADSCLMVEVYAGNETVVSYLRNLKNKEKIVIRSYDKKGDEQIVVEGKKLTNLEDISFREIVNTYR